MFRILIISIISAYLIEHNPVYSVAEEITAVNNSEQGNRQKRDLDSDLEKRPRQFVGKREEEDDLENDFLQDYPPNLLEPQDFENYLLEDDDYQDAFDKFDEDKLKMMLGEEGDFLGGNDLDQELDEFFPNGLTGPDASKSLEKRPRSFVGKRDGDTADDDFDLDKRPRQFVGKRPRQFVGKRPRMFVGKRPRMFVGKRPRMFVGKRPRMFVGKRPRMFVGKRPRSFVGKRDSSHDTAEDMSLMSKRPRQFVGKRSSYDIDLLKRPRQFVGKRAELFDGIFQQQKRPRQFVGKRSTPLYLDFAKRPRSFVGKREIDVPLAKRPRQFVGKRDFDDVPSLSKRPRQFVGKRSLSENVGLSKRPRHFVGKRSTEEGTLALQNNLILDSDSNLST